MIETLLLVLPLMLSPGPANLVTFALTARFGFSQILSFLLGISLVYILVAIVLGVVTSRLTEQYSNITDCIRFFSGLFILYLGVQLLRRTVTLADLLLLFIYLEVLAMVTIYLDSGKLPVRMPLYIAIVALARYMIGHEKPRHMENARCC